MRRKIGSHNNGFTLVELLVVIGIIALLIGILLPALSGARYNASLVACESNLHQIVIGTLGYAADNRGQMPPMRADDGTPTYVPGFMVAGNSGINYTWAPGNGSGSTQYDYQGSGPSRLLQNGYLGKRLPTIAPNTCDWTQGKVMYCPSSGSSLPVWYQYNWHMAWRVNPADGQGYLQPWFKKIGNYGKAPFGAVNSVGLPGSTIAPVSPSSGAAMTYPLSQMSLANDNIDMAVISSVLAGTAYQAGAMPHDFRGKRSFNLAFVDGHVSTVRVYSHFLRAGGNFSRDIDMLTSLELVNQGSNLVKNLVGAGPTFGQFGYAPVLNN